MALISIGGSFRDQLIDSSLISLHGLIPTEHSFSTLTTSIPSVWLQTDHQCIVWCKQLIYKLSDTLIRLIDDSSLQNTRPLSERIEIFQHSLLSNIPSSFGLLKSSDSELFVPKSYVHSTFEFYFSPTPVVSFPYSEYLLYHRSDLLTVPFNNLSSPLFPSFYAKSNSPHFSPFPASYSALQFLLPPSPSFVLFLCFCHLFPSLLPSTLSSFLVSLFLPSLPSFSYPFPSHISSSSPPTSSFFTSSSFLPPPSSILFFSSFSYSPPFSPPPFPLPLLPSNPSSHF